MPNVEGPRKADPIAPVQFQLALNEVIVCYLDDLVDMGVYGSNRSAVVRYFLSKSMEGLIASGVLGPKRKDRRTKEIIHHSCGWRGGGSAGSQKNGGHK